jgi:hypothetical protein
MAAVGCGDSGKKTTNSVDSGTAQGGEDGRRLDGPGAGDRPSDAGELARSDARPASDTRPDSVAPDSFTPLPDAWIGGTDTPLDKDAAVVDTRVTSDTPVERPADARRADAGGDADATWTPSGLGGAGGSSASTATSSAAGWGSGGASAGGGTTGTAGVAASGGASASSSSSAPGYTTWCILGYHNGGNGICVLEGTCSVGYHDNGAGGCIVNEGGGTVVVPADAAVDTIAIVVPDTGVASPDAWVAPPDTWVAPLDAWVAPPDAWVAPPDAWVAPPDTWVDPTPDTGVDTSPDTLLPDTSPDTSGCPAGFMGDDCKTCLIHVKTDGDDLSDGATWTSSLKRVQRALSLAAEKITAGASACEIWVAAGTYTPTDDTDRSATFQLVDKVGLYGGFAGSEARRSDRTPGAETILSGDIGVVGDVNDNSYHVVTGATGATIEGFTISGGNANGGAGGQLDGGGMYSANALSLTVMNCLFKQNAAENYGGGMYSYLSSPAVIGCVFYNNSSMFVGGGMFNLSSSPTVTNSLFVKNGASIAGGMANLDSPAMVTNCTFTGNVASSGSGMGMANNDASPTVTNSIFWDGGSEFDQYNSGSPMVSYSIVLGGYSGTGNSDADPRFVSGVEPYDLHLQSDSPAIDQGSDMCDAGVAPAIDKDGNVRRDSDDSEHPNATGMHGVDIGAYEYQVGTEVAISCPAPSP